MQGRCRSEVTTLLYRFDIEMKKILSILFIALICASFAGCSHENAPEPASLSTTQTTLSATSGATNLSLDVVSNSTWTVTSNKAWCRFVDDSGAVVDTLNGSGSKSVKLSLEENLTQNDRTATVAIDGVADSTLKVTSTITQSAPKYVEGGHYKIPVVFQVLYTYPNDPYYNVKKGHLATILEKINEVYKNSGVDLNLEFVMATEDPDGKRLEEPGVNRTQMNAYIDCSQFMSSSDPKYLNLIWDPDRYLNIVLYRFTNKDIVGIAQFPFFVAPDGLAGADTWNGGTVTQQNLNRPQCVSINNLYIYKDDADNLLSPEHPEGDDVYIPATIAHEIGHYLGLHHVFSDSNTDPCLDTDYCTDTKNYNRIAYQSELQRDYSWKSKLDYYITRVACDDGSVFTSDNVMDYSVSYFNRFTAQQAQRIRYTLEHAAFVPGPKQPHARSRAKAPAGKLDLPFRLMY